MLEKSLNVNKEDYSTENDEFKKAMTELCEMYNDLASEMLEKGDPQNALILLRKAEGVGMDSSCKVKTLNTLACYYRYIGKARIAENYLIKALELQSDLSKTHLNLCAVLSELGKHEEAMLHAMQAVILMQDNIISAHKNPEKKYDPSLMAIAYINLGVELEFLKRADEAIGFYKKAQNYGSNKLSPDHPITRNAMNAVNALSKKQAKNKNEPNKLKTSLPKNKNKGIFSDGVANSSAQNKVQAEQLTNQDNLRLGELKKKIDASKAKELQIENEEGKTNEKSRVSLSNDKKKNEKKTEMKIERNPEKKKETTKSRKEIAEKSVREKDSSTKKETIKETKEINPSVLNESDKKKEEESNTLSINIDSIESHIESNTSKEIITSVDPSLEIDDKKIIEMRDSNNKNAEEVKDSIIENDTN